MIHVINALVIIAILLLVFLAAGYYVFLTVFSRKFWQDSVKAHANDDPDDFDENDPLMAPTGRALRYYKERFDHEFTHLPLEELEVTSFDRLKLKGYLLRGSEKEVVICVHGYKSGMKEDFSDKIHIYMDRGTTVLLVNDRAHGNSEGKYLGFSEHDKRDVSKWVDTMNEMFPDARIYLHGVSMGGATVIHCADLKLKNVRGIIDDCGFDSIYGITRALMKTMYHVPYFPLGYMAWFWSKVLAKVGFKDTIGEECVKHTDIPIVFIHGIDDSFVPAVMSFDLYKYCASPKELHMINRCGHAAAYMVATEEYTDAVNRLLDGEIR